MIDVVKAGGGGYLSLKYDLKGRTDKRQFVWILFHMITSTSKALMTTDCLQVQVIMPLTKKKKEEIHPALPSSVINQCKQQNVIPKPYF